LEKVIYKSSILRVNSPFYSYLELWFFFWLGGEQSELLSKSLRKFFGSAVYLIKVSLVDVTTQHNFQFLYTLHLMGNDWRESVNSDVFSSHHRTNDHDSNMILRLIHFFAWYIVIFQLNEAIMGCNDQWWEFLLNPFKKTKEWLDAIWSDTTDWHLLQSSHSSFQKIWHRGVFFSQPWKWSSY